MQTFIRKSRIEAPAEEVFRWHTRPGVLERLIPPWEQVRVVSRTGGIETGARVTLELRVGGVRRRWVAEHRDYEDGKQFRDVQIEGPFAHWNHLHSFEPDGPDASILVDRITYALPGGAAGRALGGRFVRGQLEETFAYRHRIVSQDFAMRADLGVAPPMRVLVTGSSGLIGRALIPLLTTGGHDVARLVRREPREEEGEYRWDPDGGFIDARALDGVDAVVHLAGRSIASGRWNEKIKRLIRESRVQGTGLLSKAIARSAARPRVLLSASAIGYYGDRGETPLREESSRGEGFLPEVCAAWEEATRPAQDAGTRVVHARFGVVLSPLGGALHQMLIPFRLGAGGKIGSGEQYLSWVAIDDAIGTAFHVLCRDNLEGPINVVSPNPVTNETFTKTLGAVLGRPTLFPVPAPLLRGVMGSQMANSLLLSSARVLPARLERAGYAFRTPDLEGALRHLLGRVARAAT